MCLCLQPIPPKTLEYPLLILHSPLLVVSYNLNTSSSKSRTFPILELVFVPMDRNH